ncbi:MAG: hypothetical protein ACP5OR_06475 [Candidatus Dormibacteria bacterium]
MNTVAQREHYRLSIPIHRIKNEIRVRHLTVDEFHDVIASGSGGPVVEGTEVVGIRATESLQEPVGMYGVRTSLQDISSCNR